MSLITSMFKEMERCRELLKQYEDIGSAGMYGSMTIKNGLERAEKSIDDDNVVDMLSAYENLKSITG